MPIFKDLIKNYTEAHNCPSILHSNFNPTTNTVDICLNTTPECSDNFYSSGDTSGCCRTIDECRTSTSTGLKFLDELDPSDPTYNICHKDEIEDFANDFFDDANKIVKFFKLLLVAIIIVLITSIFGCCYEFWLKYGNSIECLYYKSKYNNISKEGNKANLINYMFPRNICYLPYQEGKSSQMGGKQRGGFFGDKEKVDSLNSKFKENYIQGVKCVTVYDDLNASLKSEKEFPYNLADYAENNIDSEMIKMVFKAFSFFFLYTVLVFRIPLNFLLNYLSKKYNSTIKNNYIASNALFLIFTGLWVPILAMAGLQIASKMGPGFLLTGFLSALTTILNPVTCLVLSTCIILSQMMGKSVLNKFTERCGIPPDYYDLFTLKPFYKIANEEYNLRDKVKYILANIFIALVYVIFVVIAFVSGMLSTILATIYMNFSLLFNFFYIPLTNTTEFLDLLKNHGDLITILFCIGIIGSSFVSKFDNTVTGIMSFLLVVIMFFKVSKSFQKNIPSI
tara:strand:+ start:1354 stop:2877 length:1524 start_codon:yes stop_codon:yes gene_type:complete